MPPPSPPSPTRIPPDGLKVFIAWSFPNHSSPLIFFRHVAKCARENYLRQLHAAGLALVSESLPCPASTRQFVFFPASQPLKGGRRLHVPPTRAPGADGQLIRFPRAELFCRKPFSSDHIRFWTPGRFPIRPGPLESPVHQLLHADDVGRTLAPPKLRPPLAGLRFCGARFSQQLPVMLLRGGQRLGLSTVIFIGEERGMDFAVPLQPHEETLVILFRLINPADARRA